MRRLTGGLVLFGPLLVPMGNFALKDLKETLDNGRFTISVRASPSIKVSFGAARAAGSTELWVYTGLQDDIARVFLYHGDF